MGTILMWVQSSVTTYFDLLFKVHLYSIDFENIVAKLMSAMQFSYVLHIYKNNYYDLLFSDHWVTLLSNNVIVIYFEGIEQGLWNVYDPLIE